MSWSYKDARRFAIHDKKAFKNKILPRYLNNIKFTSFTKQMRRWGFVAYQGAGRNTMSFAHPMFIRGDREGCKRMRTTQHQEQQQSSRARNGNRIISSRRGGGCAGGAMTTTNQHVSASQHHAPDDSEKEEARFLTTTEDDARLCASSNKSPMHHRQQQEKQHQQGSSYSAPQFPCLSFLSLDASSLLQEISDTISSRLISPPIMRTNNNK